MFQAFNTAIDPTSCVVDEAVNFRRLAFLSQTQKHDIPWHSQGMPASLSDTKHMVGYSSEDLCVPLSSLRSLAPPPGYLCLYLGCLEFNVREIEFSLVPSQHLLDCLVKRLLWHLLRAIVELNNRQRKSDDTIKNTNR